MKASAARAPGKVMLAGEYAVLHGHAALVMAIDRHAHARLGAEHGKPQSPFLAAAREVVAERLGGRSPAAKALRHVEVDTTALREGGHKLGLGSSAATTVAALAAALGAERGRLDVDLLFELSLEAHARGQAPRGHRGSGADVAAIVHGGVVEVTPAANEGQPPAVKRLHWPDALVPVLVWTRMPADTPVLVSRVSALAVSDPREHAACMTLLGEAARELGIGLRAADTGRAIAAAAAGAAAIERLAHASNVPLLPPHFHPVADTARRYGGAAKPTGAGGGDLILALFPDPESTQAFRAFMAGLGMTVVDTHVDREGARLAGPEGTE